MIVRKKDQRFIGNTANYLFMCSLSLVVTSYEFPGATLAIAGVIFCIALVHYHLARDLRDIPEAEEIMWDGEEPGVVCDVCGQQL